MGLTRAPFSEVTNVVMLGCACFWLLAFSLLGMNPSNVIIGAFVRPGLAVSDGFGRMDITPLKKSIFGPAATHMAAGFITVAMAWNLGALICAFSGHDAQSGYRVSYSCFTIYITYVAFVGSMVKAPGYRFAKSTWVFTALLLVPLWLEVFQEGTSSTTDTLAEELIAIAVFTVWFLTLAARHPKDMWEGMDVEEGMLEDNDDEDE